MVKNVYKSNKYIIKQKYNLNISVPYEALQYCLLFPCNSPYFPIAPQY